MNVGNISYVAQSWAVLARAIDYSEANRQGGGQVAKKNEPRFEVPATPYLYRVNRSEASSYVPFDVYA